MNKLHNIFPVSIFTASPLLLSACLPRYPLVSAWFVFRFVPGNATALLETDQDQIRSVELRSKVREDFTLTEKALFSIVS